MPSMFPSMYRSPDDPPRRNTGRASGDGETGIWPTALRWGYYLCVASAILMILSGLVMLTDGYQGNRNVDQTLIDAFMRNVRFVAVFNIIAGLAIAALAAQLKGGGRISRRWLAGVIGLSLFFNVAAFVIQVGGLGLGVIVVLLAFSALFIFRPSANEFMRRSNS